MFIFEWFKKKKVDVIMPKCEVCLLKATHKIITNKELREMDGELVSIRSNENLYCNHCWQNKYEE